MATETPATGRPAEPDAPRDGNPPDPDLSDIATALFRLRRVWAKPDLVKRIRAQTSACADGRPLQLSNLMVVNAVAALGAGAHADAEQPGEPPAEITVGAVAERLEIDPSTASGSSGTPSTPGLVSRRPSPMDARRANLGLTEAGRRVKQVSDRFRRAYLDELMAGWPAQDRAEFARLLTRFADAAVRAPMYPDGVDRIFQEAGAE
ncbi:MarR family winged helix-turn-helix transcriptional regulator [Actinomadura madurae]|uniref:MarR family winged helix-turn-helix transcriptional regulator n=1 Tax=Actinomadura madurae TaxID=1993 RepID=UPI0020D25EDD|nr:MarR family winged helix-turn-helix transcriptional regulator [Actinomadura madurae]MCQ0006044.1 MarR family winged helix-turn-helix transcriptional regulator [Actinomadura madurae]